MQDVIDCRGFACPQPVLETKARLETTDLAAFTVILDNEAARNNVSRFVISQGHKIEEEVGEGIYRLRVIRIGTPGRTTESSLTPCAAPQEPVLVIKIPSDKMGHGDDELGAILLRAFVKTIKDVTPRPKCLVMFNSGVKLAAVGSDVLAALQDLEKAGTEILVCGTCLDFYQLKTQLQAGRVSNMFEIMSAMAQADRVVSP
ncbi:MAG: sulfurtransferase-like selenium metabolism protein YedF [Deltaproteobacteria bacterium]|nr:sulfurtransferase-like selenium metabolism protein YedF [Deltaproteobacteria bacterium]